MQHDLPDQQVGDKVRIKVGEYKGRRGLIATSLAEYAEVMLDDGTTVAINHKDVTNYSLAARKAWKIMPKRSGRPRSMVTRKKQVTMRIDSEIWQILGQAVDQGLLTSREMMVNQVVKRGLIDLLEANKKSLTADMTAWLMQEDNKN